MARVALGSALVLTTISARPHAPATQVVTHVVKLDRNRFEPREIRAKPGDTIRFVNGMGGPHNVQFMAESISVADRKRIDDAMKGRIAPLTSPMFIIEGETFDFVVPALPAGRYPFLCSPHWANMRGALVVESAGASRPAQPLPGRVVNVVASEYAFAAPDTIPAGRTTFRLEQRGRIARGRTVHERDSLVTHEGDATAGFHMLWVVRLNPGRTVSDFYRALQDDSTSAVGRILGGPGFAFPPRATNATLTLEPGHHVLVCFVGSAREDRSRYHALKGMFRALEVVPRGTAAPDPAVETDLQVTIAGDSTFVTGDGDTSGAWRIAVTNSGPANTEFVILRVLDGHTAEESLAWRRRDGKPPVDVPWGGLSSVPLGGRVITTIDMTPGTYIFQSSRQQRTRRVVHVRAPR